MVDFPDPEDPTSAITLPFLPQTTPHVVQLYWFHRQRHVVKPQFRLSWVKRCVLTSGSSSSWSAH